MDFKSFFKNKTQETKQKQGIEQSTQSLESEIINAFHAFSIEVLNANKKYKRVTRKNIRSATQHHSMRKYRDAKDVIILGFTGARVSHQIKMRTPGGGVQNFYIRKLSGQHMNKINLKVKDASHLVLESDYLFTTMGLSGVFCVPTEKYIITDGATLFIKSLGKVAVSIPEIYQYFDETPSAQETLLRATQTIDNALKALRDLNEVKIITEIDTQPLIELENKHLEPLRDFRDIKSNGNKTPRP